jgi:hypothetical protein
MALRRIAAAAAVTVALAAGCGRSGSGSQAKVDVTPGGLTLLVARTAAPEGACLAGGEVVSAGLDADRDGVLDPEEIATSETVCGAELPAPPAVLTRTAADPPGTRCAAGGTRVDAGLDRDRDGVLADREVDRTAYVCSTPALDPSAVPTGTPASDPTAVASTAVLARVDPEPAGSICQAGGSAVRIGADTDRDGLLDPGEVTTVRYLCETAALPRFTIRTQADAELVAAAEVVAGDLAIEIAEPIALDLRVNVVRGGITVKSGLTSLRLSCRVVGGGLRVEGNPKLQSFLMSVPDALWESSALGGDVVVQDNPELTALSLPGAWTLGNPWSRSSTPPPPFRYPGSIVIRRNAKLERAWVGAASALAEVAGNLVIEANPRLSNLSVLDGVKRVGGDLILADTAIADSFFDAPVEWVGGTLELRDNANLVGLFLEHLQAAGGLRLARNANLNAIHAHALVAVLGDLEIVENPTLLLRHHFDALAVVAGTLSVERNAILTSLEFFDRVGRVGALRVLGNPKLTTVSFAHLVDAREVWIEENASLAYISRNLDYPATGIVGSIPALPRLETVASLCVARNPVLKELILPSLWDVSGKTEVTVTDNPLLPTCQARAIPASYRSISGNDDTAICP